MFFDICQRIFNYPYEKKIFFKENGYDLDLSAPRTINQIIVKKKLFDRNKLIPITADKIEVKNYLLNKYGKSFEKYIIPTIAEINSTSVKKIPYHKLPSSFIVKGAHLCGLNLIIRDFKANEHQELFENHCYKILNSKIPNYKNEWGYSKIKPRVLIEPLLLDKNKSIPKDYKFYCFNGVCEYFYIDFERFGNHSRSIFDREGNYLSAEILYPSIQQKHDLDNLKDLIALVDSLSKGFDFIRIDLYLFDGNVFIGEFTHYPGSGHVKIEPYEFDKKLGDLYYIHN
ncbi:hypothetical protein LZF95_05525 [Algoriphagus sp. AGSA1]|uniref:ATP-grasp fold amidoligase family protein n=1 Tax=Algoriphagus sp. AGSA1 TaxID=2907213 RepID=UPI001F283C82|nr:ATP-grasp fold amidoligase family protein [Algoriphagus sp. AGSA1]MCE7054126.1 hypothetical protein [Algoriphagus sp. AGSA1]